MRKKISLLMASLLLAAPAARAQNDGFIEYTLPKDEKFTDDAVNSTTWSDGDRLYIAPQTLHLREKADRKSESVGNMNIGDAVLVKKASEKPSRVDELVNRWYEVEVETGPLKGKSGHAFGSFLTPHRFEADLDGDGKSEIATVAFAGDGAMRVRVLDPSVTGDAHYSQVDVRPSGEEIMGQRGGRVKASLVDRKTAGVPLIKLESRIEACGDFLDAYVSYVTEKGEASEKGTAREALLVRGVSDPPVFSTFTVQFEPDAKAATVEYENKETLEDGTEKVEKVTEKYSYAAGKFTPKR